MENLVPTAVFLSSFYFWRTMYNMLSTRYSRNTRLVFSLFMALMWIPLLVAIWLDDVITNCAEPDDRRAWR